jgi:hypothetical protein
MDRTLSPTTWAIWAPIIVLETVLLSMLVHLAFGIDLALLIPPGILVVLLIVVGTGAAWVKERRRGKAEARAQEMARAEERYQVFSASLDGMDEVAQMIMSVPGERKNSRR